MSAQLPFQKGFEVFENMIERFNEASIKKFDLSRQWELRVGCLTHALLQDLDPYTQYLLETKEICGEFTPDMQYMVTVQDFMNTIDDLHAFVDKENCVSCRNYLHVLCLQVYSSVCLCLEHRFRRHRATDEWIQTVIRAENVHFEHMTQLPLDLTHFHNVTSASVATISYLSECYHGCGCEPESYQESEPDPTPAPVILPEPKHKRNNPYSGIAKAFAAHGKGKAFAAQGEGK